MTTTGTELEQVEQVEPIAVYDNQIFALVDDVKNTPQFINKTDEELKKDKAFFPTLIDYIYNNYIGDLLNNKHCRPTMYKNINQIDSLFNIYTALVYQYKWNNRPLIVEFSIFTGISRDTIYNWANGLDNNVNDVKTTQILTRERSDMVKKWVSICERALIDGSDTIKDIFLLKAKHGFKEQDSSVNITVNHRQVISAEKLPELIEMQ